MILTWQVGRAVAWLKRTAIAAERIADAADHAVSILREQHPLRRPPRHTEFSVADPREWQSEWEKAHPNDAA